MIADPNAIYVVPHSVQIVQITKATGAEQQTIGKTRAGRWFFINYFGCGSAEACRPLSDDELQTINPTSH